MVMSALVFLWIQAKVYGPVARAAVVITTTSGFELQFYCRIVKRF